MTKLPPPDPRTVSLLSPRPVEFHAIYADPCSRAKLGSAFTQNHKNKKELRALGGFEPLGISAATGLKPAPPTLKAQARLIGTHKCWKACPGTARKRRWFKSRRVMPTFGWDAEEKNTKGGGRRRTPHSLALRYPRFTWQRKAPFSFIQEIG